MKSCLIESKLLIIKLLKISSTFLPLYLCIGTLMAQEPDDLDRGDVQLECAPELSIKEFSSYKKQYKVVTTQDVSQPNYIVVKGLDPNGNGPYSWTLGSASGTQKWNLDYKDLQGKTYIDARFNMPVTNDEFGPTNGYITLKDKLGNKAVKQALVFFEKDAPSFWNPAEPDWFYYWKQFVDKGKIKSIVFNDKDNNFASTSRVDNSFVTTIRQEASEHNWVTNHDGIHTFVETLIHENKHIEIWNNWWPNGYDSTIDSDHDYVPDQWELDENGGKIHDFVVPRKDGYEVGGKAGIEYEEKICEAAEKSCDFILHDDKDWSFDVQNKNQGKQWNK